MDYAHKEHILKNLDKLIKLTKCNVMVMAKLEKERILTQNECESVMSQPTMHEKSQQLYRLLLTRKHSYLIMKKILLEERQDGAHEIFVEGDQTQYCSLAYDKNRILGGGCKNTIVYCGRYGNIPVAVKVINCHHIEKRVAMEEIEIYTKLSIDVAENIVRYYTAVEENGFMLIALELCECSLAVCIREKKMLISIPDILLQTTKGLNFLHNHDKGILHLDLKPENVLLKINSNNRVVAKISDFGKARQIIDTNKSLLTLRISSGVVTYRWMAPEIQAFASGGQRKIYVTKSADIFSLGCVFYFSLSNGNHAFGDEVHCRANIADSKPQMDFSKFEKQYSDHYCLISSMINHKSEDRPNTFHILNHPAFWSSNETLKFLSDISELSTRSNIQTVRSNFKKCKELLIIINQDKGKIFTNQWFHQLSDVVHDYAKSNNIINSEEDIIQQIITTISKLSNDYIRLPENVRESLGKMPEEFLLYWTKKFPALVSTLWAHFEKMRHETRISCYYKEFHPAFSSSLISVKVASMVEDSDNKDSRTEEIEKLVEQCTQMYKANMGDSLKTLNTKEDLLLLHDCFKEGVLHHFQEHCGSTKAKLVDECFLQIKNTVDEMLEGIKLQFDNQQSNQVSDNSREGESILSTTVQIGSSLPKEGTAEIHYASDTGRRNLGSLLFQICHQNISVAFNDSNDLEEATTHFKIGTSVQQHIAKVALMINGDWVSGNEVQNINKDKAFADIWSFQDSLSDFNRTYEYVDDNNSTLFNAEKLLGVFFAAFKRNFEAEQGGVISTAIISVPYWFSSYQRKQIEDASYVAGFDKTYLVNENSLAAYSCYADEANTIFHTVVISENSNRVDISLYTYNTQLEALILVGHSGDYQINEVSISSMSNRSCPGVLQSIADHLNRDKNVVKETVQMLEQLWQLLHSRAEQSFPHVKHKPEQSRRVIISFESDKWKDLLWMLALKMTDADYISIWNDKIKNGMFSITKLQHIQIDRSLGDKIRDGAPFNLVLTDPKNNKLKITDKIDFLFQDGYNDIMTNIPVQVGVFDFAQENFLGIFKVGRLTMKQCPSDIVEFRTNFQMNSNGIFTLISVQFLNGSTAKLDFNAPFDNVYFDWKTFNLSGEQLDSLRSYIHNAKIFTSVSEKMFLINDAIRNGAIIKEAISKGNALFRNSLQQHEVFKQIDKTLGQLRGKNETVEEIKIQNDIFINIAKEHLISLN